MHLGTGIDQVSLGTDEDLLSHVTNHTWFPKKIFSRPHIETRGSPEECITPTVDGKPSSLSYKTD